jgi:hypothetical protein
MPALAIRGQGVALSSSCSSSSLISPLMLPHFSQKNEGEEGLKGLHARTNGGRWVGGGGGA